jgi:uncharacterized protein (TIGR03435 family)
VVLPAAIFLGALTSQAASAAAPAGLASAITIAVAGQTAAALTTTAATCSTLGWGKTILNLMALSKLKTAAVAAVALLAVGGATNLVIQRKQTVPSAAQPSAVSPAAEPDEAAILRIIDSMNSRSLSAAPPYVYVRPTRGADGREGNIIMNGRMMGRGATLRHLLAVAYGSTESRVRLAPGVPLSNSPYSYLISVNAGQKEALQKTLREQFGLSGRLEKRTETVYAFKTRPGEFDGRQPAADSGPSQIRNSDDEMVFQGASIEAFGRSLERILGKPVIDETGLSGRFDFLLTTPELGADHPDLAQIKTALAEQVGFDLQSGEREIEVLVVEATPKGKGGK